VGAFARLKKKVPTLLRRDIMRVFVAAEPLCAFSIIRTLTVGA